MGKLCEIDTRGGGELKFYAPNYAHDHKRKYDSQCLTSSGRNPSELRKLARSMHIIFRGNNAPSPIAFRGPVLTLACDHADVT